MAKLSPEEEKDAVDYITNCMFSIDFLKAATEAIFDSRGKEISLTDFYHQWLAQSSATEVKLPFSPGAFLGLLFVGVLYAKENWYDLIPDAELGLSDPAWGLNNASPVSPKKPKPTLRYTVRRIRNSLGHGTAIINVPKGIKRDEMLEKVTFRFRDTNPKNPADSFEVELSMQELITLIRQFQDVVHKYVRTEGSP